MPATSLGDLDALLKHFDEGYLVGIDEAYRRFREHEASPPDDLPEDPFSAAYAARYLALYKQISGRSGYVTENERSEFDVEARVYRPFPYFSESTKLAAQHYFLISELLAMLELKPGSAILECGFGWGNTTLALAMLGHHVTGLDVESRFCEVVRRRAELLRIPNIDVVCADYLWTENTERMFDAVVFFESFHHCWEFQRLLTALHRVLKPGGRIYFAAEPITPQFAVPWGIRLDGESLFVARKWGWMELGFHDDFFAELLDRTGWAGRCVKPQFWQASSKRDPIVVDATDPRISSVNGRRENGALRIDASGDPSQQFYAFYGPYLGVPKGAYRATIQLAIDTCGKLGVDACRDNGAHIIAIRELTPAEALSGPVELEFSIAEPTDTLEIRLCVTGEFSGRIERIVITRTDLSPP